jgi:hypothetical protein
MLLGRTKEAASGVGEWTSHDVAALRPQIGKKRYRRLRRYLRKTFVN